jgi:hypothetical protein
MCQTRPVAINPRSITEVERPWLEAMANDHAAAVSRLKAELRKRGVSSTTIMGMVGWLGLKAAGEHDDANQSTKAKYRAILRDVDCPQIAAA